MRPDVVLAIEVKADPSAERRRDAPNAPLVFDSTSSVWIPSTASRKYATAMRPDAGSIAIAGRTAFRPLVTRVGGLQVVPSTELATKTALCVAPAAAQSCHATQMRPLASASADGSGNARKPAMPQEPATSATRTGAPHDAPPSLDVDAAMANRLSSHRYATTSSPAGRITGNTPTAGRAPMSTPVDQVSPPSSDHRTASMSRSAECV